jgi:hypothetical protein
MIAPPRSESLFSCLIHGLGFHWRSRHEKRRLIQAAWLLAVISVAAMCIWTVFVACKGGMTFSAANRARLSRPRAPHPQIFFQIAPVTPGVSDRPKETIPRQAHGSRRSLHRGPCDAQRAAAAIMRSCGSIPSPLHKRAALYEGPARCRCLCIPSRKHRRTCHHGAWPRRPGCCRR